MTVPGRRDRVPITGEEELAECLSVKVLHGWMQNRQQTLLPLTVNFKTQGELASRSLAEWMAVACLAVQGDSLRARSWLGTAGASPQILAVFDAATVHTPPIHAALSAVAHHGVPAHAYIAALIAGNSRDPVVTPFLDYVAASLTLPTTVVRSAVRRYRW